MMRCFFSPLVRTPMEKPTIGLVYKSIIAVYENLTVECSKMKIVRSWYTLPTLGVTLKVPSTCSDPLRSGALVTSCSMVGEINSNVFPPLSLDGINVLKNLLPSRPNSSANLWDHLKINFLKS